MSSFAVVTWEIDTSDAARSIEIVAAVKNALKPFPSLWPLSCAAILKTTDDNGGIDGVRGALDRVAGTYQHSFFYLSVDAGDDDPGMEGIFPGLLVGCKTVTGDSSNPSSRAPVGESQANLFALVHATSTASVGEAATLRTRKKRGAKSARKRT